MSQGLTLPPLPAEPTTPTNENIFGDLPEAPVTQNGTLLISFLCLFPYFFFS
jgi:hypothetical protein